MRLLGISALIIVVLFILNNTEGYMDWPTQIVSSEQPTDTYLDSLLKAAGYQGKKIDEPNPNLFESTRVKKTLDQNGYAPPRSSDSYLSRNLADGQQCWSDSDCLSRNCINSTCTSALSPPMEKETIKSSINIIVNLAIIAMALLVIIMFIIKNRN
jgi:hypothetical protein